MNKQQADFTLRGGGSVYLLFPDSIAAEEWIADNIQPGALTLGNGIAIEWRCVDDICNGIVNDGLTVERS